MSLDSVELLNAPCSRLPVSKVWPAEILAGIVVADLSSKERALSLCHLREISSQVLSSIDCENRSGSVPSDGKTDIRSVLA